MNKPEVLEGAHGVEGEGKLDKFVGIQPGANPQRRKMPLPHKALCIVLAIAETYSWALLFGELRFEHLVPFL